jgi:hypothetical protein
LPVGIARLELKVRDGCDEPYVEVYVDGEDIDVRLSAALGHDRFDGSLPWYGIDYSIDETVFGEAARRDGAGAAILFACGCGCAMCSSVSVSVVVDDATITLSHFVVSWGREQSVAAVDPIVFDRRQFEEAVAGLPGLVAAWRPRDRAMEAPPRVIQLPAAPDAPGGAPEK